MARIFHRLFLWKWIPCQALTSILCLLFRPKTVHCSTKNAYTSEITFLALHPWLDQCYYFTKESTWFYGFSIYTAGQGYAKVNCFLFPITFLFFLQIKLATFKVLELVQTILIFFIQSSSKKSSELISGCFRLKPFRYRNSFWNYTFMESWMCTFKTTLVLPFMYLTKNAQTKFSAD